MIAASLSAEPTGRPPFCNPVTPFPPADAPVYPAGFKISHESLESPLLGERWGYVLILPPSYAMQLERKFPLILWLHGAGGGETSARNLNPLSYLARAMTEGKVPEAVIVVPSGLIRGYWHDDAWISEAGVERAGVPMAAALVRELLPRLEETLRIRTDRDGRAVMGFSMGGYGAMNLALTSGKFAACVSLDGSIHCPGEESDGFKASCRNDPALLAKHNLFHLLAAHDEHARRTRFYFSWGGDYKGTGSRQMHQVMAEAGIPHLAEDLTKEIPVHHAYRFLVPETGGDNIYRLLREVFALQPAS